jgi:hypothetical protein
MYVYLSPYIPHIIYAGNHELLFENLADDEAMLPPTAKWPASDSSAAT